jgi:Anti-sigma-K factor rskA, C-terminal
VSASDEDRIAYLAGEDVGALAPDDRAELDELRGLLDDESVWTEPPPELEDRVVTGIADESRAAPSTAAPTPEHAKAPQGPAARPRRQGPAYNPERRFPSILLERPKYMAAALAGLVAIIAVVTLLTTNGGNSRRSQQRFAMVVNGTDLAPGAHGTAALVKENSGWQITLKASGLPVLANGRYYQAWLSDSAGTLVPIGTFNDAVDVTLWSGVSVTQFGTLIVTRQRAEGNPGSSGQRVLTGTIQSRS